MNILSGKTVLITGGTGSFGRAFVRQLLASDIGPERIRILSRDEVKQAEMREELNDDHRLRWFLGDVRDQDRIRLACRGAEMVVHAAALKRVDACAYSPFEAVQTNVVGTWNVLRAALDSSTVTHVVALSSDKACAPLNLYGKTKACMEDLVTDANAYAGQDGPRFAAVRYGNVAGSRGSVIPSWRKLIAQGRPVPVTDHAATRFWFTLRGAADLVLHAFTRMQGGELFVPDLPSFSVGNLAVALGAGELAAMPRRRGDKRHEVMVSKDEAPYFRRHGPGYVRFQEGCEQGTTLRESFEYSSDTARRMSIDELRVALTEVA